MLQEVCTSKNLCVYVCFPIIVDNKLGMHHLSRRKIFIDNVLKYFSNSCIMAKHVEHELMQDLQTTVVVLQNGFSKNKIHSVYLMTSVQNDRSIKPTETYSSFSNFNFDSF